MIDEAEADQLSHLALWSSLTLFPIAPGTKTPTIPWGELPGGTKAIDRSTGAYGIATGSRSGGLVVLDIDCKNGKDGYASLDALGGAPDTFMVETASGGAHLYYVSPRKFKNSVDALGSGLDVRAEGGYVVGPGTPGYTVADGREPVPLPDYLASLMSKAPSQVYEGPPTAGLVRTPDHLLSTLKGARGAYAMAWRQIAKGERFIRARGSDQGPDQGPVDAFLTSLLYWLAQREDWADADPMSVVALMGPSLSHLAADDAAAGNPTYTPDQIARKFSSAASKARGERQANRAVAEAIAEARRAVEQGETGPLILQHRYAYYLADPEVGYTGPYLEKELWGQARDRAVFEVEVPSKNGNRRLPAGEMVQLYGKGGGLVDVRYNLCAQRAVHDPIKRTLTLPSAIRPEVRPEFHRHIHDWLTSLGGDTLLDWIAVVTELDQACPALWITGESGIGKSLLERGVAALWGFRRAVPMYNALSRFNDMLLHCPVVSAEEQLPTDHRGHPRTEDLKALITATSHRLEPKGLPLVDVEGAVRVLLSSNNLQMIRGSRDITPEDAQALVERFVHIRRDGQEAERIKEGLLDHPVQREWIDGGALARHFAYLIQTRKPPLGRRLRLDHVPNGLDRLLRTQPGGGFYVCRTLYDWIIQAARAKTKGGGAPEGAIVWREGTVRTSVKAVKARLVGDRGAMHDRTLGDAVRRLSRRKVTTRMTDGSQAKLWEIDLANIEAWCDQEGWGDVDALAAAVLVLEGS